MAKLLTDTIIITLSKMVRNDDDTKTVLDNDTMISLVSVITELAGDGVIVEIE